MKNNIEILNSAIQQIESIKNPDITDSGKQLLTAIQNIANVCMDIEIRLQTIEQLNIQNSISTLPPM